MPSKRSENRKGHTAKGVDIDKGLNKGRGFAPLGDKKACGRGAAFWEKTFFLFKSHTLDWPQFIFIVNALEFQGLSDLGW